MKKKCVSKMMAEKRIKPPLEPCRHPAIFQSMCVSCGKVIKTATSFAESRNTGESANSESPSSSSRWKSNEDTQNGIFGGNPNSSSLLFSGGQRLLLSKEEALRVQQSKLDGLQSVRKLALVLDLDHTLVHATGAWLGYATSLGPLLGNNSNDIRKIFIEEVPGTPAKCYLVKSRPHLEAFLKEAHTLFQMSIYTAGTRLYAEAVAKLMDPLGIYFARRIVSRTDIPNDKTEGLEKSLQRIFLQDASMVAIMDDREDVWKGEQAAHLLLVRPFHYFTGCEEVNNAAGGPPVASGPLIKLSGDKPGSLIDPISSRQMLHPNSASDQQPRGLNIIGQNDYDDQLPRCLELLKEIHDSFFSPDIVSTTQKLSVAKIITGMKLSILKGCTIAFSGVIPVKYPTQLHPSWQLAESMGARVTAEVTDETTHLISISMPPPPGAEMQGSGQQYLTSKAKECLGRGDVWVLHPDWLSYCRYSLAKAEESTFMLVAQLPGKPLPNPRIRTSSEVSLSRASEASVGNDCHSRPNNASLPRKCIRFEDDNNGSREDREDNSFESKRQKRNHSNHCVINLVQSASPVERADEIDGGNDDQLNRRSSPNGLIVDSSDEDESGSEEGTFDDFDAIILQR
jgi:FCP1-like phosphatase family protein